MTRREREEALITSYEPCEIDILVQFLHASQRSSTTRSPHEQA